MTALRADAADFRKTREARFGKPLEEVVAGRDKSVGGFRRTLEPMRLTLNTQPCLGGKAELRRLKSEGNMPGDLSVHRRLDICGSSLPVVEQDQPDDYEGDRPDPRRNAARPAFETQLQPACPACGDAAQRQRGMAHLDQQFVLDIGDSM
jgi:hypothetical protein